MAERIDPQTLTEREAAQAIEFAYQSRVVSQRAVAGWIRLGYASDAPTAETALRAMIAEQAQLAEDDANRKGTNHIPQEAQDAG